MARPRLFMPLLAMDAVKGGAVLISSLKGSSGTPVRVSQFTSTLYVCPWLIRLGSVVSVKFW